MKITVVSTKRDAAKGMKNVLTADGCPLGLALNRALKAAGISLTGRVIWGGKIEIGWRIFSPKGLAKMPGGLSPEARKFLSTPRRFSFEYDGPVK